jgi:hypothetical protein
LWADVESDGEEVVVFDGRHLKSVNEDGWQSDDWSVAGRRAKNGKPRPRPERTPAKPEPVAARQTSQANATSRSAVAKQVEDAHKPASVPYRPPKPDTRQQAVVHHDRHYDSSHLYSWEASSWGASGSGWKSSSKAHGTSWDEGTWDRKQDAHRSAPKADSRKGRGGGKDKSESFKRGPAVTTNMDSSRLAW